MQPKKLLPLSHYVITVQLCNVTYKTKETVKLHVLKIIYILYAYVLLHLTSLELNNMDRKSCAINPLNPELNPICYSLALLGAHHFLHVSRIRVKLLTFSLLMSYLYMEHPFLMFLDHTQRRSTVGRTPLYE